MPRLYKHTYCIIASHIITYHQISMSVISKYLKAPLGQSMAAPHFPWRVRRKGGCGCRCPARFQQDPEKMGSQSCCFFLFFSLLVLIGCRWWAPELAQAGMQHGVALHHLKSFKALWFLLLPLPPLLSTLTCFLVANFNMIMVSVMV